MVSESMLYDGPSRLLRQSLSGLVQRQQLIANNLANIDTPGYRSVDIDFERALQRRLAADQRLPILVTSPAHMSTTGGWAEQQGTLLRAPAFREDGNGVDVDAEMARLSETVIQYNVVSQLLAARIALMRLAVTEGRR